MTDLVRKVIFTWDEWDNDHRTHLQYAGSDNEYEWKGCIDCNDSISRPRIQE